MVFSTNKTDSLEVDILTIILSKVALNTINKTNKQTNKQTDLILNENYLNSHLFLNLVIYFILIVVPFNQPVDKCNVSEEMFLPVCETVSVLNRHPMPIIY